jgi:hypothetical protein
MSFQEAIMLVFDLEPAFSIPRVMKGTKCQDPCIGFMRFIQVINLCRYKNADLE